eukprot:Gregarina_sp_Pseudo_9__1766@NODE_21_length_5816_cov_43_641856_g19_i0_p6_GENE_NODE_21_length_5816_cov_43_641856_g19_i0NODE_21_length_5816_cov_43_641856_g19_i0_p6_ORF_typecomplete_len112_score29_43Rep_facA_3/PF08661_11/1_1e14_NODE_21_length_5816_cov_43_641856_g19_i0209544
MLKRLLRAHVSIIGKVEQWGRNSLTITTTDGKAVECQTHPGIHSNNSQFVMVAGKVAGPTKLVLEANEKAHFVVPLGDTLDMNIANSATMMMYHPQVREQFEVQRPHETTA